MPKKTCFVVMGFGEKVDLASGRKLNLDASYRNLIKPTAEDAGLECHRADEIANSGNINVPMYREILTADVVIADLSTSNNNAFYELGVRHALRPFTTIIIAEEQFTFPFDIAQISIQKYKHLGDDIGVTEANRFRTQLKAAIQAILATPTDDSPVYTFLHGLRRLKLPDDMHVELTEHRVPTAEERPAPDQTHSALMQQVSEAKKRGDFATAKALLTAVRAMMRTGSPDTPEDPFIVQQLALATYKSKQPTAQAALLEARDVLTTLNPATSNDTETLGLWGAVHKRLWEVTKDTAHLDEAVRGYERGFYLRNDYYNGINLAYLLNLRAATSIDARDPHGRAESIADFVQAERVRREVIGICKEWLSSSAPPIDEGLKTKPGEKYTDEAKYWVMASLAEAYIGIGDDAEGRRVLAEAAAGGPEQWMKESSDEQMANLRKLLADTPLKHVKADPA